MSKTSAAQTLAAGGTKKDETMKAKEVTAENYKKAGNEFFKKNDFTNAILLYTKAINLAEEKEESPGAFYNNRAFAHFKLESYGAGKEDATKAIENKFLKGYYRRGQCNMALMKTDEAWTDFKKAKSLFPKEKNVLAKWKACKAARREKKFLEAIRTPEVDPLSHYREYLAKPYIQSEKVSGPVWPDAPASTVEAQEEDTEAKPEDGEEKKEHIIDARNAPLSKEFVLSCIEHFKNQKTLQKRHLVMLLMRLIPQLQALPNVVDFETAKNNPDPDSHITICGDTHGQFYDLLEIFRLNGYPSKKNPYLFNGDYVDRGAFSCEVIITLLLWKAHDWDCMHLTRGNHEGISMNLMYGFKTEAEKKYSNSFNLFTELFNRLPLSYRINKKILVLHGGLFNQDGVTIEDIQKVHRFQQIPDGGIMCDILWSDPDERPGRNPSKRGTGVSFGPDVTKRFLDANGLDLLIRSHEMKMAGNHWQHDKRVLTIFSAPNYCDMMNNKGAFIRVGNDSVEGLTITEFTAVEHPKVQPAGGMMNRFR